MAAHPHDEIYNGFILRPGRLRLVTDRERPAATHLIAHFPLPTGLVPDGLAPGTLVWFRGNTAGVKAAGGFELGPEALGTQPRGFWTRLEPDLSQSMRIDRQKYFVEDGQRFCDFHLQVGAASLACVLVRVNVFIGEGVMRRAFTLSLDRAQNVMVCPSDPSKGYMHVRA
jgi:hypothetical protein